MEKENNCSNCKHTNKAEDEFLCSVCVRNYIDKYEPITNYDRIKNMSVDEMAKAIYSSNIEERCHFCKNEFCTIIKEEECIKGIKKYLLQEVEQ